MMGGRGFRVEQLKFRTFVSRFLGLVYREGGEAPAEAATEQRSPTDRKEAASEALALISSLNNPIKVRWGIF